MKTKWLHLLLHLGCLLLLLAQVHRIQQLQQSEREHYRKALAVRELFFDCGRILKTVTPGIEVDPELNVSYWRIIGPAPNW